MTNPQTFSNKRTIKLFGLKFDNVALSKHFITDALYKLTSRDNSPKPPLNYSGWKFAEPFKMPFSCEKSEPVMQKNTSILQFVQIMPEKCQINSDIKAPTVRVLSTATADSSQMLWCKNVTRRFFKWEWQEPWLTSITPKCREQQSLEVRHSL